MSKRKNITPTKKDVDTDEEIDSGEEDSKPVSRTLTATMLQEQEDKMDESDDKAKAPAYNTAATCIEDLGYTFKDKALINIKTGGKFKFIDQKHYELLGDFVAPAIQKLMTTEYHMKEDWVPRNAQASEKRTNIFYSDDFFTNKVCNTPPCLPC